jgi:putative glutamine transport system substrate-binding protein
MAIRQRGVVRAGVALDSRPFGYVNAQGQPQGYDVDLLRELGRRILGKSASSGTSGVEFYQVIQATRMVAVNSGAVDLVAAVMTITPERERVVDFTIPYYMAHQMLMTKVSHPAKHLADLAGQSVAYVNGTTSYPVFQSKIKKAPQAYKLSGYNTYTEAYQAMRRGDTQALVSDNTVLIGFRAEDCDVKILADELSNEPYGVAIKQSTPEWNTSSFRNALNNALNDMTRDGTLDKLRHKWLDPLAQQCASAP